MARILYVSHENHLRMGAQNSMANLIEFLDKSRFSPYCIMPSPGELSEKLEKFGCKCLFGPLPTIKPKYTSRIPKSIKAIRNAIRRYKIDIAHADFEADIFTAGMAKIATKCKLIWHVRLTTQYPKDVLLRKFPDAFIGISEGVKRRFPKSITESGRFRIIYNGVDCGLFRPPESEAAAREKLGLPAGRFILLFVGQIKPGKGIYDIADALKILKRSGQDIPFTAFVGAAPNQKEKARLQAMINNYGLGESVKIYPQQKKIYEWMQAADALILPSHEGVEGMGRVLFEAMACGCAAIGSDTSGVREAISEKTGILVKEKSPGEIAMALNKLMTNMSLLESIKNNGRERALNVFDIRTHARKVEKFYKEIL